MMPLNISLEAALGFSGPEDYAYSLNAEERSEEEYSYTFSIRLAGPDFSGPRRPRHLLLRSQRHSLILSRHIALRQHKRGKPTCA